MAQGVDHKEGPERREFSRVSLKTSIHIHSESNFYTGFTRDISEGGLFIATHFPVPIGEIVEIEFSLPDSEDPIRVQGEVRWIAEYNPDSDGFPGLGLKFINLTDHVKDRIESFIKVRDTLFFDEEIL